MVDKLFLVHPGRICTYNLGSRFFGLHYHMRYVVGSCGVSPRIYRTSKLFPMSEIQATESTGAGYPVLYRAQVFREFSSWIEPNLLPRELASPSPRAPLSKFGISSVTIHIIILFYFVL